MLVRSQSKIVDNNPVIEKKEINKDGINSNTNNPNNVNKNEVIEKKEKINFKDETPTAQLYAKTIPQVGKEARSFIRQLNYNNDLKFLRIRTEKHEILISPDKDYYLCVVQSLDNDLK